jgi:hypothetical protein
MASILYYSNYCEHSKKLLQTVSKSSINKDIHFICIDKRTKGNDGKIYIILENGQKIVMPENVNKVPALLLLNDNYRVLYGDNIYNYMKPKQEVITKQATSNNMEPMAFSLSGSNFGGIVSDNFSFLDMDSQSLNAQGDGGLRQMHNYVALNNNDTFNITTPKDDHSYKSDKIPEGVTIEKLQQQRENDLSNLIQPRK